MDARYHNDSDFSTLKRRFYWRNAALLLLLLSLLTLPCRRAVLCIVLPLALLGMAAWCAREMRRIRRSDDLDNYTSWLLLPIVILCGFLACAMGGGSVEDGALFWMCLAVTVVLSAVLIRIFWSVMPSEKGIAKPSVFIILFCFFFSLGELIAIDQAFDHSVGTVYETRVINRFKRKGRHGSIDYYLLLAAWGDRKEPYEMKVDQKLYDNEADTIYTIHQHPGAIGMEWLEFTLMQK